MGAIEQRRAGSRPPGSGPAVQRQFAANPRTDTDELLDRLTQTLGQLWSHDMSLPQLDRYAVLLGHAEKDALERVQLREDEAEESSVGLGIRTPRQEVTV